PRRRPSRLRDRPGPDEPAGTGAGGSGRDPAGRRGRDVSCQFTLEHYRDLLHAARKGGYRWAGFDRPPEPGVVILRHDVDLSLEAALTMAELEADAGAWSPWFMMTRSIFC